MSDDYSLPYHIRYQQSSAASPIASSPASFASSSSSASSKLSLKNFHVCRRTAAATTTTLDIAHFLDPAYNNMSSSVDTPTTGGGIETHELDFRLFAPATHSPKRREFLTILPSNDEDEEENYWGEEEKESRHYGHRASFDSYRSPSRASDPIYTYSNYQHFDRSYAYRPSTNNDWYDEPASTASDVFYLSDEERQPRSQTRSRRESNKLRRKRVESESVVGDCEREDSAQFDDDEKFEQQQEDEKEKPRQARSLSPLSASTTHSFRRQWLALRLRTQFAAFHARKNMSKLVRYATAAA